MKARKLSFKLTIITASLLTLTLLAWSVTRNLKSSQGNNSIELNYILPALTPQVTLDVYESERYELAVIIQQLIGNLVHYSNHGRYEPRLAESWNRPSDSQWDFTLKRGYTCENGEVITPDSFKQSLLRSIKAAAAKGQVPVFSRLIGFQEFIARKSPDLSGIVADGEVISFRFAEPTRTGLLQVLSFAPFGYICADNLNADLSWKDPNKFISSGPYKLSEFDNETSRYWLIKRNEWPGFARNSPDTVRISRTLPTTNDEVKPNTIVDSSSLRENLPNKLTNFPLVPEYLSAIVLGNLAHGFFADINNRRALDQAIQAVRKQFPNQVSSFVQSPFFVPTQQLTRKEIKVGKINHPASPLVIGYKSPKVGTQRYLAYQILIAALDSLGWKYKMTDKDFTWADYINPKYDLRLMNPSVGYGIEAWTLDVIFYSPIGSNMPDPSGRVKKLLHEYETNQIDDQQLTDQFLAVVEEDSAIFPISHAGFQWYISPEINTKSISQLISVIRFDQTEIND